jgi:hypothetical protein
MAIQNPADVCAETTHARWDKAGNDEREIVSKIDETGNRYGRLLVLSEVPRKRRNNAVCWRCLCDCGKHVIARGADLRYGATKSCGCLKAKKGYKRAYRPDGTFYFVKPENCPAPPPRRIARNGAKKK